MRDPVSYQAAHRSPRRRHRCRTAEISARRKETGRVNGVHLILDCPCVPWQWRLSCWIWGCCRGKHGLLVCPGEPTTQVWTLPVSTSQQSGTVHDTTPRYPSFRRPIDVERCSAPVDMQAGFRPVSRIRSVDNLYVTRTACALSCSGAQAAGERHGLCVCHGIAVPWPTLRANGRVTFEL